jgi:hypothetical protein
VKTQIFRALILMIAVAMLAGASLADTIELKSGQLIQGKFLGGSEHNVRFLVNGKEELIPVTDILNISFNDTGASLPDAPVPATAGVGAGAGAVAYAPAAQNPAPQTIDVPAGTAVLVRMIDSVDSSRNSVGDIFHASLEDQLVVDNTVVAPKGADVYGRLANAKSAGHISGSSELTLELTGIRINGQIVPVSSTDYDVAGKGRGKQSAERIGGGAALGAIIGAIAGGGKGAAIGAGVGAGAGTAVQVVTHGEQVRIPSETLLEFRIQQPVTVTLPAN